MPGRVLLDPGDARDIFLDSWVAKTCFTGSRRCHGDYLTVQYWGGSSWTGRRLQPAGRSVSFLSEGRLVTSQLGVFFFTIIFTLAPVIPHLVSSFTTLPYQPQEAPLWSQPPKTTCRWGVRSQEAGVRRQESGGRSQEATRCWAKKIQIFQTIPLLFWNTINIFHTVLVTFRAEFLNFKHFASATKNNMLVSSQDSGGTIGLGPNKANFFKRSYIYIAIPEIDFIESLLSWIMNVKHVVKALGTQQPIFGWP